MRSFLSFITRKKIPSISLVAGTLKKRTFLSVVFYILLLGAGTFFYLFLWSVSISFSATRAIPGGTVREGVIGAPRFINPLFAASRTDIELVDLLYRGLLTKTKNGDSTPSLASYSAQETEAGTRYTFSLREDARFSDGSRLTAADAVFTYTLLQEGSGSEALQARWRKRVVSQTDEVTLTVLTPPGDDSFLSDATIGILPQAYWSAVESGTLRDAPSNLEPIGAGPFRFRSLSYENDVPKGIIIEKNPFSFEKPALDSYQITIFPNQALLVDALTMGAVDFTAALSSDTLLNESFPGYTHQGLPTNQTLMLAGTAKSILSDPRLFAYIESVIDKRALLATIDSGYGLIRAPNNSSLIDVDPLAIKNAFLSDPAHKKEFSVSESGMLLKQGVPIRLSLVAESNTKEALAANFIKAKVSDAGIETEVRSFESGTFRDLIARGEGGVLVTTSLEASPLYSLRIPLYTYTTPFISNRLLSGILLPSDIPSIQSLYLTAPEWHARRERVWKWFLK